MVRSYQVRILSPAIADLKRLDKVVSQRVINKIRWLAENFDDIIPEILHHEFKGLFKLRVGDWRVIYTVNLNTRVLIIHLIGHRREIYK
jgi:mRNA interferase RelE/StbE